MINELTKRRVFRVLSGYAVVCFICLQIADVTFEPLGIDGSVLRVVIAIMLLALPVVGYLGWVFDLGPNNEINRVQSGRPWLEACVALVAVVLLAVASWMIIVPETPPAQAALSRAAEQGSQIEKSVISKKSVAVLPFEDLSEAKDQGYLAEGIAEEIINLLVKVPDLRVPARTSSFYFRATQTQLSEIAHELSVAQILQGSVRRNGDRVRISAQLVEPDSGYVVWAETYDRYLQDIFEIQDEIANAVVDALQIKLMGGRLIRRKGGTQNLDAYQSFLRGSSALAENSIEGFENATMHLERAIELDPEYGEAMTGLAFALTLSADNYFIPLDEGYERARNLAKRALELSPELADAHAVLQNVYRTYDWDWAAAEKAGKTGLATEPSNTNVRIVSGMLGYALGRWADAERHLLIALERDPLHSYAIWNLGATYYSAGRFKDAEVQFRRLLEVEPSFLWGRGWLGKALLAQGQPEAALEVIQKTQVEEFRVTALPLALDALGRTSESNLVLERAIQINGSPSEIALVYANRDEFDLAFHWMDVAVQQRDAVLFELLGDPLIDRFKKDPRYRELLKKMNLPWRRS